MVTLKQKLSKISGSFCFILWKVIRMKQCFVFDEGVNRIFLRPHLAFLTWYSRYTSMAVRPVLTS